VKSFRLWTDKQVNRTNCFGTKAIYVYSRFVAWQHLVHQAMHVYAAKVAIIESWSMKAGISARISEQVNNLNII
jgi:hypothetical protein